MPDEAEGAAAPDEKLPGTPQPGMMRIEKAGKKGYQFTDGSILWDDGEKEVPTSGISDEQKQREAREAAGDIYGVTKQGVSDSELASLGADMASIGTPEALMSTRKAAAKLAAGKKPSENDKILPPTEVELKQGLRMKAKQLLEREIDRLEELKTLAIAGTVEIELHGVPVNRSNPPMALHEAILTYLRVADSGNPSQMHDMLRAARGWQPKAQ
jgi:hypothetical protein